MDSSGRVWQAMQKNPCCFCFLQQFYLQPPKRRAIYRGSGIKRQIFDESLKTSRRKNHNPAGAKLQVRIFHFRRSVDTVLHPPFFSCTV